MPEIYLAGGCFWGLEKYLASIRGVTQTQVGYANGETADPVYEDVCRGSGHAETVRVVYNPSVLPLSFLLTLYYEAIDPAAVNRQGNDSGVQYRTGIYYSDVSDRPVIEKSLADLQEQLEKPVAVESVPLKDFYTAEDYHQKYLEKNPDGYCHIKQDLFERAASAVVNPSNYTPPDKEALSRVLTPVQFEVTQKNETEPPFQNKYCDHFKPGIYVDITSGEPLFSSADKFDSGCGWPSFSRPIDPNVLREKSDLSHGMIRTEVRSRVGDAHLGHVFNDGPKEQGSLRYCINSSALRFIPKQDMQREGYGYLLDYIKE